MDHLCSVAYGLLLENAGKISAIQLLTIKYLFVDKKISAIGFFIIKHLFVGMALGLV